MNRVPTDPTPHPTADPAAPPRWPAVLLVAAVLLTFGRLAAFDFTTWDDRFTVYANPRLNPPTPGTLWHYLTHEELGLWVPVTYAAWAALASVARVEQPDELAIALNPYVFHAANVLVHCGSAVAALALLRRLLAARAAGVDPPAFAGATRLDVAAMAGALLYALHPVQVESVGWVSGLKDVLAGCLGLSALLGYVSAVRAGSRREATVAYAAATVAVALAMLSKPSAVTVPLLAAALDRLVLGRAWRDVARGVGPWLVIAAAVGVVAKLAQPGTDVDAGPLWARPLIVGDSLAFYLGKLAWPFGLAIDYGRTPERVRASATFWVAWLAPAAIGLALFLMRRRHPTPAAAGAVFALAPLPVLGLLPFMFQQYSTVADHYLYVAMLGPALLLAWAVSRVPPGGPLYAAVGAVGVVLALLAVRAADQAGVWRDSRTLFSHAVAVNPRSWPGWTNLGGDYDLRRDDETAARMYRRSIEAQPNQLTAYSNLAMSLATLGRFDEAERVFAVSLRRRGSVPPSERYDLGEEYANFGGRLLEAGAGGRALPYLAEALRLRPDDPDVRRDYRTASESAS